MDKATVSIGIANNSSIATKVQLSVIATNKDSNKNLLNDLNVKFDNVSFGEDLVPLISGWAYYSKWVELEAGASLSSGELTIEMKQSATTQNCSLDLKIVVTAVQANAYVVDGQPWNN